MSKDTASKEGLETTPYEELIEELDAVVSTLEGGDLTLEESLGAFERGVKLAKAAERQLDRAEHRVEVLLQDGRTQPLGQAPQQQGPGGPGDDEDIPF